MTRHTLGKEGLPAGLQQNLRQVGEQIRLARKRRGVTMQAMADRMFVTRKTLSRLESGDPGVSLGVVASALLVLGLEQDLLGLARPETDAIANIIDKQNYENRQRVRSTRKVDMDF